MCERGFQINSAPRWREILPHTTSRRPGRQASGWVLPSAQPKSAPSPNVKLRIDRRMRPLSELS